MKIKRPMAKSHVYARYFCRAWYNGSYTMMVKPMKTLELHYPMIQFLIISATRFRETFALRVGFQIPNNSNIQITLMV